MKVTVAAFAYNERPYIPYMVEYYRSQGCDLLILDNYSNDGTYEWLMDNEVKTVRVDTNESFHLMKLQAALVHELKKVNPDWVVYCGVDCYYFFEETIIQEIMKAERYKRNAIETNHFSMFNTGEQFQLPFPTSYFYGARHRTLRMIAKYDPNRFRISADWVYLEREVIKLYTSSGVFINYGMCKPKHEREKTYERRQKAWMLGERRGHGVHYAPAQERNWIWDKESLEDIRSTEFYKMIK
jgi:glycosyltransferase involved in cell wall biosynthesis